MIEPTYHGKPVFYPEFDFNPQCQADLLSFCDKLKTDPQYNQLIKRKDGLGLVYCFIEELAAFNVKGDLNDCDYVRKGQWRNETWQVDPGDFGSIMPKFLKQRTCFDETQVETIGSRYQDEIGWDGLEMKFAAISSESNMLDPWGTDGESMTRKEYDQYVAIGIEQAKLSQSCGGDIIMTDLNEKFVFMNNQAIYVNSAITSAIYGVVIAFVVLLISTRVFHCESSLSVIFSALPAI